VVTGLSADDPLSVRAARMKLYLDFMQQIDAGPDKVSKDLSEVDLSDPEDVKALVPSAGADILVHFGQKDFLHRYQVYAAHVAEWKSANPRLASVDMRYEHQVVLEMAKPAASEAAPPAEARPEARPEAKTPKIAPKSASKPLVKAANKPVAATSFSPLGGHLQTPFDVHPKPSTPQAVPPR
jgi:cell division protein FtsQ